MFRVWLICFYKRKERNRNKYINMHPFIEVHDQTSERWLLPRFLRPSGLSRKDFLFHDLLSGYIWNHKHSKYTHTHTHIWMYVYTHIYMYLHTHTHTLLNSRLPRTCCLCFWPPASASDEVFQEVYITSRHHFLQKNSLKVGDCLKC